MIQEIMDPEMRELQELFARAIVPRNRRRTVVRMNYHSTYYNDNKYRYI